MIKGGQNNDMRGIDGEKIEIDKKIMTPKLQEGENLFD